MKTVDAPITDTTTENYLENLGRYICCIKTEEYWQQEKEIRLLIYSAGTNKRAAGIEYDNSDGYKVHMPNNAVKGIIIGHNMKPMHYKKIIRLVKLHGIKPEHLKITKYEHPKGLSLENITIEDLSRYANN